MDLNHLPCMGARRYHLEVHVTTAKFYFCLVNVGGHAVLVGDVGEMIELAVEHVGDIIEDFVFLISEKPGVPVHCRGGSPRVELCV